MPGRWGAQGRTKVREGEGGREGASAGEATASWHGRGVRRAHHGSEPGGGDEGTSGRVGARRRKHRLEMRMREAERKWMRTSRSKSFRG